MCVFLNGLSSLDNRMKPLVLLHILRRPRWPCLLAVAAAIVGLAGCRADVGRSASVGQLQPEQWSVCFSPRGGCTQQIIDAIGSARQTILVQAYSFTSRPIAEALIAAHGRGVAVEVIADSSQRTERQSLIGRMAEAGVPVRIDAAHAIAHNKVMILDGETVLTGSFNFTRAAEERNAENLLTIRDRALADRYTANWRTHAAHSPLLRVAS